MSDYTLFISKARYADLDFEVVSKAKVCLLDALGAMLGSQKLNAVRIAQRFAAMTQGSPFATILGAGVRTAVQNAALANGAAAAALDIDDCHVLGQGHPGAVIIPAAMSAAEAADASGKELLAAIVAGYEVAVRSGALQISRPGETLVWGSGRWACPGAAAAAAKLLGLNSVEIGHAVGIADTFAPKAPLLDTVEVKPLPMTKESIGWGSHVGVAGALLARQGYTGPWVELDQVPDKIGPMGEDFAIMDVHFKPYPSCRWTHSAIDAVLALMRSNPEEIVPERIAQIRVRVFKKAMHINHPRPDSVETAQYSIPFTIASAIADGEVWLEQMSEARLKDSNLLALAQKVKMIHAPEFDQAFPARPEEVEISTQDGRIFRKRVDFPKGDMENPMSQKELQAKFLRLAGESVQEKTAQQIIDSVEALEDIEKMSFLIGLIHQDDNK